MSEKMTYDELFEKYRALLSEAVRLKSENAELKKRLGVIEPETVEKAASEEEPAVTKRSSPADKIALFRSLFAGRDDVFARRWYGKTTGKSGYQPVCETSGRRVYATSTLINAPIARTES